MKKIIIIIIVVVLLAGAGIGGYFYAKNKNQQSKNTKSTKKGTAVTKEWNPYATDTSYMTTLNDYLLSAVNGDYVVKMTVDVKLKNEESYQKYEGLAQAPDPKAKAAADTKSAPTDVKIFTPMQQFLNSKVNTFMLNVDENTLHTKNKLEKDLKDYLNQQLALGSDFIKEVYIENLVIQ